MGELILADGPSGGASMFIFIPFILFGLGIIVLAVTARERKSSRPENNSVRTLPTAQEQPLRHVHVSLASHRQSLRVAAQEQEEETSETPRRRSRRSSNGTHLRRVV